MKTIIILIVLGIVQGFTEPLPISSSGHMRIIEALLNVNLEGMSFEAFVNFGSTIAIMIYFKDKIKDLFVAGIISIYSVLNILLKPNNKEKSKYIKVLKKNKLEWSYILKIIVATLPLVVVGLFIVIFGFFDLSNVKYIGISLIFTAISLFLVSKLSGSKSIEKITYIDCIIIGLFQAIAIMPGISRSGMSLVGALIVGMNKSDAFEFIFILYLPASLGALILSIISMFSDPNILRLIVGYICASLAAGIFTYVGLLLLKNFLVQSKLKYFSLYCAIVGSLVLIFL